MAFPRINLEKNGVKFVALVYVYANFQKTIIHQISNSKDLTSSTEGLSGPWFNAAGLLRYDKELSAKLGISTELPILHDTNQSDIFKHF